MALFDGMTFYIPPGTSGRRRAYELIERNGGAVASFRSEMPSQINLLDRHKLDSRRQNLLAVEYIEDCVRENQLLPRDTYMADGAWSPAPAQVRTSATTSATTSRKSTGRKAYTDLERGAMLAYVLDNGKSIDKAPSRNFWEMAAKQRITPHSSESMHEHFRKQIVNRIPADKHRLINFYRETQSALVAESRARLAEEAAAAPQPEELPASRQENPQPERNSRAEQQSEAPGRQVAHAHASLDIQQETPQDEEVQAEQVEQMEQVEEIENVPTPSKPGRAPRPPIVTPNVPQQSRKRLRVTPQSSPPTQTTTANASAHANANAEDVDRWIETLRATTGMPRDIVVHALYCCSGNPHTSYSYLRGQSPLECWGNDEDVWIQRHFGSLLSTVDTASVKKSIREVVNNNEDTLERERTVQMIFERLVFLEG